MTINNKDTLKAIDERHMHAIDKMYRMFAGLSSHLLAYEEGTLTLQVHHSKRWTKDPASKVWQFFDRIMYFLSCAAFICFVESESTSSRAV